MQHTSLVNWAVGVVVVIKCNCLDQVLSGNQLVFDNVGFGQEWKDK